MPFSRIDVKKWLETRQWIFHRHFNHGVPISIISNSNATRQHLKGGHAIC